jgi:ribosomal protein S18 acetylase RimI-like enzyme
MSTQIIRAATSEDAGVLAEFNIKMAWETEHKTLDPTLIQNGVLKLFEEPDLGFYTLVEMDGEIAGALMITSEWSDWRNGLFWWIQSVYILPEYRRRGIFTALYNHIRHRASQDPEICGLRLYVEKENTRAQQTYIRAGMKETGYRLYEEEF